MTSSTPGFPSSTELDRAWQIARESADRAGVRIEEAHDSHRQAEARRIFDEVWPTEDGSTQVRPNLLRALVHAGGYCVIAHDSATGGAVLGATLAFLGHADDGTVVLHSHMSGVVDTARNRHIGTAMKQHQRAWAWEHGIPVITWTFDPLVRRNAVVNLVKLGIEVRGYHENFYGEMDDAMNAGDPTDRMVAWWPVASTRAAAAAEGTLSLLPEGDLRDHLLVATPEDIVALRSSDPGAARQWRLRVREQLVEAIADGYVIDGVTEEGSYALRRTSGEGSP